MSSDQMDANQSINEYWMTRGWFESARLHLHHFIAQQRIGFHLHESIPESVRQKPDLKVADIACANGIWLLELSTAHPSTATFTGFDITPAHFPPRAWLPPNIRFAELDILTPELPAHLHGAFDIINARSVISILPAGDATPFLRAVSRMLKPGGYLQWLDLELGSSRVERSTADQATPHLNRAFTTFKTLMEVAVGKHWRDDLEQAIEHSAAGLQVVRAQKFGVDPLWYKANMDASLMSIQGMGANLPPRDKVPAGMELACREEWADVLRGCAEEAAKGAGLVFGDALVAVARKGE